jgi:hypothetical protein
MNGYTLQPLILKDFCSNYQATSTTSKHAKRMIGAEQMEIVLLTFIDQAVIVYVS